MYYNIITMPMINKGGCKVGKKADMGGCKEGLKAPKKKKLVVVGPVDTMVATKKTKIQQPKQKAKVIAAKPQVAKVAKVVTMPKKKRKLVVKKKAEQTPVVADVVKGKQSDSDKALQKVLKQYLKHNWPYGGGSYEVLGGKLYVNIHRYDYDAKERSKDELRDYDFGANEWRRLIKGDKWGDMVNGGYHSTHSSQDKFIALRKLKLGDIKLKQKELLKGYTLHDVYELTSAGRSEKQVGRQWQIKGDKVYDMFGQTDEQMLYIIPPSKVPSKYQRWYETYITKKNRKLFSMGSGREMWTSRTFMLNKESPNDQRAGFVEVDVGGRA